MPPIKSSKFARLFKYEYLEGRKDITPIMLSVAKGDVEEVKKGLEGDNLDKLYQKTKDQNSLLLLAVGNNHVELASFLLDLKADVLHQNIYNQDALDYATAESIRSPLAKVVLSRCDYVVPDVFVGPYSQPAQAALATLREQGKVCCRTSVIGKTPDFADLSSKVSEYRTEWLKKLVYICGLVRKGMLLLHDEVDYLLTDARLTGALDVPMNRRHVFLPDSGHSIPFRRAMATVYAQDILLRLTEAAHKGDVPILLGLLKAYVDPNVTDKKGQTVLMRAAQSGEPQALKLLLQARANVNAVSRDGYPALLLAAVNNGETEVRLLVRAKADLSMRTTSGNSILDFVKHEGRKNILEIIRQEREALKQGGAQQVSHAFANRS